VVQLIDSYRKNHEAGMSNITMSGINVVEASSVKKHRKVSSQAISLLNFRHLFALFKSIGIIAGFQNIAVLGNAIQQRGDHLGVAEDLDPSPKIEMRGGVMINEIFSYS